MSSLRRCRTAGYFLNRLTTVSHRGGGDSEVYAPEGKNQEEDSNCRRGSLQQLVKGGRSFRHQDTPVGLGEERFLFLQKLAEKKENRVLSSIDSARKGRQGRWKPLWAVGHSWKPCRQKGEGGKKDLRHRNRLFPGKESRRGEKIFSSRRVNRARKEKRVLDAPKPSR